VDTGMSKLWQDALVQLEASLNPQYFATWIKPLRLVRIDRDLVVLEVPNRFVLDWVRDNYAKLIQQVLSELSAVSYRLQIDVAGQDKETSRSNQRSGPASKDPSPRQSEVILQSEGQTDINLNRKYTFDEFVAGSSNQFAFAAAMAVANNPATTYNPLFIYGGVGLGKTHLINAIGNAILKKSPAMRVCYYTSEKFTNELINSIRYNRMDEFHKKFRSMDILLIDDIQFIAGKERTQEEFFHTFNTLHDGGKQIVVTSDKFPKDIPNLEGRLRSRFEWGLIADIQPPEMETKIAIIEKKAQENNLDLPHNVANYIASHAESNIRELEGFLIRIGAFSSLTGREIDLDLVREVLKNILKQREKEEISIDDIVKTVAGKLNLKIADIKSPKKNKNMVLGRQVAMFLARQLTPASYPDIGEKIGGKDHSTVIYAYQKIARLMETDAKLKKTVQDIEEVLQSRS